MAINFYEKVFFRQTGFAVGVKIIAGKTETIDRLSTDEPTL